MTFLELSEKVLSEVKKPLTVSEIWRYAEEKLYVSQLGTQGKTPWATLAAQLHVNARDNKKSPFAATSGRPKKFYLKALIYSKEELLEEDFEVENAVTLSIEYSERDLHSVLSYFIFYHMHA